MKHLTKSIGKCLSLMLALIMCMSLSIPAFATEERIVSDEEIAAVLDKLNAEYHTNIHALSAAELTQLGLPVTNPEPMTVSELAELENTLRNIAETQIPQFKRNTQEAFIAIANIGMYNLLSKIPNSDDILPLATNPVTATKEIEYAVAGAVAYISENLFGKSIWGEIQRGFCITDTEQSTWFRATNPTVTRIESNSTLYWVGTGSYYSNINGTQYYLYSGTQYASMYVSDYD